MAQSQRRGNLLIHNLSKNKTIQQITHLFARVQSFPRHQACIVSDVIIHNNFVADVVSVVPIPQPFNRAMEMDLRTLTGLTGDRKCKNLAPVLARD